MIEPNFNLLLWIIFIFYGVSGVMAIIAGALGSKKSDVHGIVDVLVGLIYVLICFVVCIF